MRIRQVRPSFWSDEAIGRLPDAVKLFYIGLWNVADDAGWLTWRPPQIAAELYPYKSVARREREVSAWIEALSTTGRVRRYDCGCLEVPNLPKHQRVAGNQSFTVRDIHANDHANSQLTLETLTNGAAVATSGYRVRTSSPVEEGRGRVRKVEEGISRTPTSGDRARGSKSPMTQVGEIPLTLHRRTP